MPSILRIGKKSSADIDMWGGLTITRERWEERNIRELSTEELHRITPQQLPLPRVERDDISCIALIAIVVPMVSAADDCRRFMELILRVGVFLTSSSPLVEERSRIQTKGIG